MLRLPNLEGMEIKIETWREMALSIESALNHRHNKERSFKLYSLEHMEDFSRLIIRTKENMVPNPEDLFWIGFQTGFIHKSPEERGELRSYMRNGADFGRDPDFAGNRMQEIEEKLSRCTDKNERKALKQQLQEIKSTLL